MNDLNNRFDDLHNRCNETNSTLRLLITQSDKAHRDLNRQIVQTSRLISKVDKDTSICAQKVEDHLKYHKKDDERMNINGVKITSIISSFGSAIIGAYAALYAAGL